MPEQQGVNFDQTCLAFGIGAFVFHELSIGRNDTGDCIIRPDYACIED